MWGCKCYVHVCAQIQVSRIEVSHVLGGCSVSIWQCEHCSIYGHSPQQFKLWTDTRLADITPQTFLHFLLSCHFILNHLLLSPPSPPPFTSFPSTLHLLPLHPSPPSPPPFTSFHLLPHLSSPSPHLPSSLHTSHTHHDTTAHLHMQRSSVHPHRRQWWVLSHPFVRPSELCRPGLHHWLPGVALQLAPCRRGHRQ